MKVNSASEVRDRMKLRTKIQSMTVYDEKIIEEVFQRLKNVLSDNKERAHEILKEHARGLHDDLINERIEEERFEKKLKEVLKNNARLRRALLEADDLALKIDKGVK